MSSTDFMPLEGWDHVELWVGNAKQAAYFYEHSFGYTRTAYAGPETGVRDRASYVVEQGDIRLVLTSGLRADSEVTQFACRHGDGARDISLQVPSADGAYRTAVQRGARGIAEPRWVEDEFGRVNAWVEFYERVFGMTNIVHFGDDQIQTEYSALMSKVMADGSGKIKFPINEPAEGKRKSQIEEYLEFNHAPGVQHIAMQSEDIVGTVTQLKERGVLFLDTPDAYYEEVEGRVGEISEDYTDLKRLKILADRDEDGYLLQIFTKTAQDRPTVFFEVIERHGATTFGEGNFKALFESIEREQALRGNL